MPTHNVYTRQYIVISHVPQRTMLSKVSYVTFSTETSGKESGLMINWYCLY